MKSFAIGTQTILLILSMDVLIGGVRGAIDIRGSSDQTGTGILRQLAVCGDTEGYFQVEATYRGQPSDFNIGVATKGFEDVINLFDPAVSELAVGVLREGCFQSNTLSRFEVSVVTPPKYGEFQLSVNGNEIASGSTFEQNFNTNTGVSSTAVSYNFYADVEECPEGTDRFALTIQFDVTPDEIKWDLTNTDDGSQVLSYTSTLPSYSPECYPSNFFESFLYVDHCLVRGPRYRFTIEDSFGDGIISPGYYKIKSNGILIASASDELSSGMSTFFTSDGVILKNSLFVDFPTQSPTPDPNSKRHTTLGTFCFSGSTTVKVKDKGIIQMRDLHIGDKIAVGGGVYEPVYSFGHYEPAGQGDLLLFVTNQTKLQVSGSHLVFMASSPQAAVAVPAASVRVGDLLLLGDGRSCLVESIRSIFMRDGLYAPFTPSGKLLVNDGLLVSSFIGFDLNSGIWSVGAGVDLSYQWLAHSFEFPHRVVCYYFRACPRESYSEKGGLSSWVSMSLNLAVSLLTMESSALKSVLVALLASTFLVFNFVETLLHSSSVLLGTSIFLLIGRRIYRGKQKL